MKIGFIKLGSRYQKPKNPLKEVISESIRYAETLKSLGHQVWLLSARGQRNTPPEANVDFCFLDEAMELNLDTIIVYCGFVDFIGGKDTNRVRAQYQFINQFAASGKKVYFIMNDIQVPLNELRANHSLLSEDGYTPESLGLPEVEIITQGFNTDYIASKMKSKASFSIRTVPIWQIGYSNPIGFNENPEYDFSYACGRVRKNRWNQMAYWLEGAMIIGNDILVDEDFVKKYGEINHYPVGKVLYSEMPIHCNKAMATIIFGDTEYEKGQMISNRLAECIAASVVCFIDTTSDVDKKLFKNPELDWLYVDTKEQLQEKISFLKDNLEFRRRIVELQHQEIDISNLDFLTV